jgi:chemotaxis response regulator CheB
MPKSAIEAGVVDRVVPLSDMASTIVDLVQRESRK